MTSIFKNHLAINVTLHCLTGCAIGEILGLIIGIALGLSNLITIFLAIALAFIFGYSFSVKPLIKNGIDLGLAIKIAFIADTLSIATMELVDNFVMYIIPGALHARLVDPLFWVSMIIALGAAFVAAVPVNDYLLKRNKGHMVLHEALHSKNHSQEN
jgi:hypothetical protein